jgi:hypothetical protein
VICPHCEHDVPLTWKKYFSSWLGHHKCPGCLRKFKIVTTVSSIALVLAATIFAAATPAVIAFYFEHSFWYTIATYVFFIVVVVIPFDRWADNKVRPTKPVPPPTKTP